MKTLPYFASISLFAAVAAFACEAKPPGPRDGDGEICLVDCEGKGGELELDGNDSDRFKEPAEDCGNGEVDVTREACDDGNNEEGDGCWANCLGVEKGYICREAGEPCQPIARCGDGAIIFPEQCDDGNAEPGDGCSENCKVELGYKCDDGEPCTRTTCGDDKVEGAEMCEPNLDEGCTSQCQFAPDCSEDGACTSECGDGLVLGEKCDDGNRIEGDGCDANCQVEDGYTCEIEEGECERGATGECILRVPVTYRDFSVKHASMERDKECGAGLTTGNVGPKLVNGIPEATGTNTCWAVDSWYTDSPDNVTFHDELILYENGNGGFVNRWGPEGQKWHGVPVYENLRWCGQADANCGDPSCGALAPGETCWTSDWPQGCCSSCSCAGKKTDVVYDGTPVFFPLDGLPGAIADGGFEARIGPHYGFDSYITDEDESGTPIKHNFHFSSEVTFWFPYDSDTKATLDFSGDDDVYVFINGHLALDLGGFHQPEAGAFTITGGSPTISGGTNVAHEMETGQVYEIKVFHAERQTDGSTFKLTLSGFNSRRSDCTAICGDGTIGFGEECDDGVNDGGYNECQPGCTLGEFCGDGVKQDDEACDDADPKAPAECSGCNLIVVR